MTKTAPENLLIGAHTSASGGAHNALIEGGEIGATTIQFFTRNQRQWKAKPLAGDEIAKWDDTLEKHPMKQMMSHASYLINLGSPDTELRQKSIDAFAAELTRCQQLGIAYLNFHPGAYTTSSEEECLNHIIESLNSLETLASSGKTRLLLETTAGQGTVMGHRFEHHNTVIKGVSKKIPIGVCMDTCHTFSAGYDMRTKAHWDETLAQFDKIVGLKHLYAFHLNDSMKPFGERKDRHAPLGEGEIGIECFRYLMTDEKVRELPKYLETPGGPKLWKKEIAMLREFAKEG